MLSADAEASLKSERRVWKHSVRCTSALVHKSQRLRAALFCIMLNVCFNWSVQRTALFRPRAREKKANNPGSHQSSKDRAQQSSARASERASEQRLCFLLCSAAAAEQSIAESGTQQPEFSDNRTNERGSNSQCTLSRTHYSLVFWVLSGGWQLELE